MIPVSIKNQIFKDIRTCIKEQGKEPNQCIIEASKNHGLSKEQAMEIVEELTEEED